MATALAVKVSVEAAQTVGMELLKKVLRDATMPLPIGNVQLVFSASVNLKRSIEADVVDRGMRQILLAHDAKPDFTGLSWVSFKGRDFWLIVSYTFPSLTLVDDDEVIEFLDADETENTAEWGTGVDALTFFAVPKAPKAIRDALPGFELVSLLAASTVDRFTAFSPVSFLYVYGERPALDRISMFLTRERILTQSMERGYVSGGEFVKFRGISAKEVEFVVEAIQIMGKFPIARWWKSLGWRKAAHAVM